MPSGSCESTVPSAATSSRCSGLTVRSNESHTRSQYDWDFLLRRRQLHIRSSYKPSRLALFAASVFHDSTASAKQPDLDGVRVQSQQLGDLFHRKPFDFLEHQHAAVAGLE